MLEAEQVGNVLCHRDFKSGLFCFHLFRHVLRNEQVPLSKINIMLRMVVIDSPRAAWVRIAPLTLHCSRECIHILLGCLGLLLKVLDSRSCLQSHNSLELSSLDIREQVKVNDNLLLGEPFIMIPQNTFPLYRQLHWDGLMLDSPRL